MVQPGKVKAYNEEPKISAERQSEMDEKKLKQKINNTNS